ncbi:hypothetical protein ACFFKE_23435 [Streptomyces mutabilis]|uniref:hypothetical protein n=1 Tax=Streptomyces mutabilis TaxID=67332 RepID=UPI00177B8502|nr:hypothetical protein [Streptomyces mutabilis]GGQ43266.1 hypothetical protein GCM10010279_61450 [Streptomyces mutabilis]
MTRPGEPGPPSGSAPPSPGLGEQPPARVGGAACAALRGLVALGVRTGGLPLAAPAAVLFVLLLTQD